MMPTLSNWSKDIASRRPASIKRTIRVSGVYGKHLGPRWDRARVDLIAEPADHWLVEVEMSDTNPPVLEYLWSATLGILDVLAAVAEQPLLNVRIRIVGAEVDPVESNNHAFRMAGRDAARNLLAAAQH